MWYKVRNGVVTILVCFLKMLQKNFTFLEWNVWIGGSWFGWMRCHQLKLWLFRSCCMVIYLLIWMFRKN